MRKYFGTDGVRGRVGDFPITPDFALRLGYALGKVLANNNANGKIGVIIGKDTRLSGYLFESSLEAGLCYAGCDVYMAGPIPTPAVAYLTRALHLSAGIVISASHNPYYDNGIKFFSSGGSKLSDAVELDIEAQLDQPMEISAELGKVFRQEDGRGRYIEFCKNTFLPDFNLKKIKIVVDCANGATYQVAPSVFQELGAIVIKDGVNPDGVNINHECGSTHPQNLIDKVLKHKADLGIAFDGDGDRVVFVDRYGKLYNGDQLIYVILKMYIERGIKFGGVVGTVMTNLAMENALNKLGIKFVRSKVGDRYVLEELLKNNWLIGGEASGHILCLDKHSTGDAIIAALQVLAAMCLLEKDLPDLVDWQDYPQVMINVRLSPERKHSWHTEKVEQLIQKSQQELDGSGRIVVRASGTEPVVRVMVEATDMGCAKDVAKQIADAISA